MDVVNLLKRWRYAVPLAAFALAVACSDGTRLPVAPGGMPVFAENVPENPPFGPDWGQCMGDDAVQFNQFVDGMDAKSSPLEPVCKSGDVAIAKAVVTGWSPDGTTILAFDPNDPPVCVGATIDLELQLELVLNANQARHDIGAWVGLDGQTAAEGGARTGRCAHFNATNAAASDVDGDSCGDLDNQGQTTVVELGLLTLACAPDENDNLLVPACLGWKVPGDEGFNSGKPEKGQCPAGANSDPVMAPPNADLALGFRAGTLPSNKTKCNCEPFVVPITVAREAELEVRKVCGYTGDPGKFELLIDGTAKNMVTPADGANPTHATCAGGNASTTGPVTVSAGTSKDPGETHTFGETAVAPTDLDDYSTTWECRLAGGAAGTKGSGTGVPVNQDVDVDPSEHVICTITNTGQATLIIRKVTDPASAGVDFGFTGFDGPFDLAHNQSRTLTGGTIQAGIQREIFESNPIPLGYDLHSIACTGTAAGNVSVDLALRRLRVTPQTGETVTCTFTNNKRATVTVVKDQTGGGAVNWLFEIRNQGGNSANVWADGSVLGSGNVTFRCVPQAGNAQCVEVGNVAHLKPGNYAVCEVNAMAGWTTTVGGAQYEANDGAVCVDITLGVGGSGVPTGVNNPITNEPPPEGDQRTIGYWRNWSSCSNGKQWEKALEGGFEKWTLDQNLPQTVGLLVLAGPGVGQDESPDCLKAKRILEKRDVVTNAVRANDAAFSLAAQFLAALLNAEAGAATCPLGGEASFNAFMTKVQNLLVSIGFTGTGGPYLGPGTSSTDKTNAITWAGILDEYNNGNICA